MHSMAALWMQRSPFLVMLLDNVARSRALLNLPPDVVIIRMWLSSFATVDGDGMLSTPSGGSLRPCPPPLQLTTGADSRLPRAVRARCCLVILRCKSPSHKEVKRCFLVRLHCRSLAKQHN